MTDWRVFFLELLFATERCDWWRARDVFLVLVWGMDEGIKAIWIMDYGWQMCESCSEGLFLLQFCQIKLLNKTEIYIFQFNITTDRTQSAEMAEYHWVIAKRIVIDQHFLIHHLRFVWEAQLYAQSKPRLMTQTHKYLRWSNMNVFF